MAASKAQRAAAAKKRAQAVALRIAGMDWATIAERTGYRSAGAACTAVTEAMKANLHEQAHNAEELRALTVMRYDRLQAAYWPDALKGDKKAADVVLKCLAGRARIEGTEAPTRLNVDAQKLGDEILALLDDHGGDGAVP
ncbi:hypothetical protein ABZ820_12570 [Streptomyces diacarni]|uniref:hypothetical protein n=1 Tax=Streptomyces diacarni TaxID=2800381 RepID=UPI0033E352B1